MAIHIHEASGIRTPDNLIKSQVLKTPFSSEISTFLTIGEDKIRTSQIFNVCDYIAL